MFFELTAKELANLAPQELSVYNRYKQDDNSVAFLVAQELTLGTELFDLRLTRLIKKSKKYQIKNVTVSQLPLESPTCIKGAGSYKWHWSIIAVKKHPEKKIKIVDTSLLTAGLFWDGKTILDVTPVDLKGEELEFNRILFRILHAREQENYKKDSSSFGHRSIKVHTQPKADSDYYLPMFGSAHYHKRWAEEFYLILKAEECIVFKGTESECAPQKAVQLKYKNFVNSKAVDPENYWIQKFTPKPASFGDF